MAINLSWTFSMTSSYVPGSRWFRRVYRCWCAYTYANQVVLSAGGKIVGFQPTSRVAVNQWAANPLAKELYGGRKLSPGNQTFILAVSLIDCLIPWRYQLLK